MATKNDYSTIDSEIQLEPAKYYNCNCGSTYKYSSGCSRHKKVCNFIPTANNDNHHSEHVLLYSIIRLLAYL